MISIEGDLKYRDNREGRKSILYSMLPLRVNDKHNSAPASRGSTITPSNPFA